MQVQEISLMMLTNDSTPTKKMEVSDATFDSFMSDHASKVSEKEQPKTSDSGTTDKDLVSDVDRQSTNSFESDRKIVVKSENKDVVEIENVDVSEMLSQTMAVLQDIFQLSEEELTGVMEQMGMQIQDLLFQIQGEIVVPVDVGVIREFVLDFHGVEDSTVILTNDLLNQEIGEVTQELTNILAENFGIEPEKVVDLQQDLQPDFLEQLQQKLNVSDRGKDEINNPTPMKEVMPESGEKIPVILEHEGMSQYSNQSGENRKFQDDSSSGFPQESMTSQTESFSQDMTVEIHRPQTFTENLSQVLEHVEHGEQISAERTMTQIVEQIVRQVRIRVMPETTSMEMQLNPASLGRVNLTVATTGGVATATMVVENQMAKNALESQLISLKESFAEQGLKVEEVEVTVAEFGLKKENEQQQENMQQKKSGRRFRSDDELVEGDDVETDLNLTSSQRRDSNSVVDYTA